MHTDASFRRTIARPRSHAAIRLTTSGDTYIPTKKSPMYPVAKCAQPLLLICAFLFNIPTARGQDDSCLRHTIQFSLLNHLGQPVADLSPSQFVVTYRGKPVRIISITPSPGPRRVLILMDASGNLQSTHAFDSDVADELLDDLPQGTYVGVMVFAKRPPVTPIFTTDRDSVRKQLQSFRDDQDLARTPKGSTALFDALHQGKSAFGTAQEGDSLYVISDGVDHASQIKWGELDDELIRLGIRVFGMRIKWLGVDFGVGDNLPDMITFTGGSPVVLLLSRVHLDGLPFNENLRDDAGKKTRSATEIDWQARFIADLNKMQIELPEPPRGKREVELRLVQKSPELFLVFQHTLPPCSTAATK